MTAPATALAQYHPTAGESPGQPVAIATSPFDSVHVFVWSDRNDAVFGQAAALGPGPRRLRSPRRASDDFNYAAGVCTAPCAATVSISENPYRIVGHDLTPSRAFNVRFAPRGLDVSVRAGSWGGYVVGLAFTAIGAAFIATGSTELLVWEALGEPRVVNRTPGVLLPGGIAGLGLGVVFAAVGIPLFVTNQTRLDISEHQSAMSANRFELTK